MKVAMRNNTSFTLSAPLVAGDESFFVTGYVEGMNDDLVGQVFLTAAIEGAPVIECQLGDYDATAGTATFSLVRNDLTHANEGYIWAGATVPSGTVLELRVTAEMIARATNQFDELTENYAIIIANEPPTFTDAATASGYVCIGDWIEPKENCVSIGNGAGSGEKGVAIGRSSTCASGAVAIGESARADAADAVAIGRATQARSEYSVSIGYDTLSFGTGAVAIGYDANSSGTDAVVIGTDAEASGPCSIVMGKNASDAWGIGYSIVLGQNAEAKYASQAVVAGLFCLPGAAADGTSTGSADKLVRHRAVPMSAISSQLINLATVAGAVQVSLPSGMRLYIDRIDVIQTATSTATTTPQLSIGTSDTEKTSILAASDITVAARYARQSFTPATAAGVTSIYIDVPTAANAAKNVRVVFTGYLAA